MMPGWGAGDLQSLLLLGAVVMFTLWLGLSAYVVVNRLAFDRRDRRLAELRQLLDGAPAGATGAEPHAAEISRRLARLPHHTLHRLMSDVSESPMLSDTVARYTLARRGLDRIVRDASARGSRGRWRRISALFVLGRVRAPESYALLQRALAGPDAEVASAAVVVLRRLDDRRAAEILIDGLRTRSYSPSRIATQLDQFALPIDDLLRPLLHDPLPHVRYWAVSLLGRYSAVGIAADVADEIAALADDHDATVRKAALATLSAIGDARRAPVALRAFGDSAPYVRSTAIRAFVSLVARDPDDAGRRGAARHVAPLLADTGWEVRLAAKESLVTLGSAVWPEVSALLDSPDRFARNGAAEVLQNLGVIDRLMEELGRGATPGAEVMSVLARAIREGGIGLSAAAAARSDPEHRPSIEKLFARLQPAGEGAT